MLRRREIFADFMGAAGCENGYLGEMKLERESQYLYNRKLPTDTPSAGMASDLLECIPIPSEPCYHW